MKNTEGILRAPRVQDLTRLLLVKWLVFKHAQGGRQASSLIASVSVDCICIQLSAFVGLGVCFFSV